MKAEQAVRLRCLRCAGESFLLGCAVYVSAKGVLLNWDSSIPATIHCAKCSYTFTLDFEGELIGEDAR